MLNFACNLSRAVSGQHVHLTADAKLTRQVNARLNREACVGNDFALVFSFQVVHVGAIAVDAYANRMSGAMRKILPEPGRGDMPASGFVYFPSSDLAPGGECLLHLFDSGIAGIA